uniref:Vomeronasal type-1 receptor n=1 Tax=Castor canadensis TaxID=51338 RepID=A0A8C0WU49_CASCN
RSVSGPKSCHQHWPNLFFTLPQSEVALKTALLFHSGVGTVANVILFFHNVSPLLVGHRLRPTQVLFTHLASANTLVLLSTGIPHSMVAFVPRNSLSSLGCKLTYYIHQMGHTATLCSTCVLSIYQAVTVIPMNAGRIIIKGKAQEITRPSCYTCWMFSTLINVYIPMRVTGLQDKHNYTDTEVQWFCSSLGPSVGFVILLFISKATFIGLTGSASGSMVLLLCRHHKRKQHIHTSNLYHKGPPESRAAHTILMLVAFFIFFYILDSIFTFYITAFVQSHLWVIHVSYILNSCFPTVCLILLIFRDPRTPSFCF